MDATDNVKTAEPLVELMPEEAVLPALAQSAHPVEWIESNAPDPEES